MMPPFITVQSMNLASLGAENSPLDRAFGKLEGIAGGGGGGGGAPIPITPPRLGRFEPFLIGISPPGKVTNDSDSRLWQARGYNETSNKCNHSEEYK
jgi:hypothetical protein